MGSAENHPNQGQSSSHALEQIQEAEDSIITESDTLLKNDSNGSAQEFSIKDSEAESAPAPVETLPSVTSASLTEPVLCIADLLICCCYDYSALKGIEKAFIVQSTEPDYSCNIEQIHRVS